MGVNTGRIRNVLLGLLIVLSFYLSVTLWTTGRNIGEEEDLKNRGSTISVSLTSHSEEDVFRPNNIAIHGLTPEEPLLLARSNTVRDFLKENLGEGKLSEFEQVTSLTIEEYIEKFQIGRWLEFIYPEEIPFGLIDKSFIEMPSDKAQLFFDRAFLDLDNPEAVYFYHSSSKSLYHSMRLGEEQMNLNLLLDNEDLTYLPAEMIMLQDRVKYLTTEPLEIFYRTYVIHQLPKSSYISNFFPDTSLVDVRSATDSVRYIDLTKEVTINDANHTLTYLRQIYTDEEMDPHERYRRSFQQINQFENWAETFILSSYDQESQMLSFRREIQGIPVFSNNDDESISEVSLVEEGVTYLKIPLRYADTPINIKGAPIKELVSGVEMMEELRATLTEEEFELIGDFSLGYSWEESEEESQVINFKPNWYVFYDQKWIDFPSLLELSKETDDGF